MDHQFKQTSAPSIISSTVLPSNLSANGSSSSRFNGQLSNNFWDNYEHLCALQNVTPLQSIKQSLTIDAGSNLSILADKLKNFDWDPFLNALRVSKHFRLISIQSSYNTEGEQSDSKVKGYAKLKKPPAIRNKEKTNRLCRSLKDCLSVSTALNKLELFNIPLSVKDCSQISKGLRSNKTVKFLSLDKCLIGDEGLAVICKEIQNTSSLNRVDFSSCNLSSEGANILATLIKVQALKRHNEAWKDSLRYGRPDLDSMFGIRRITINSNEMIGDKGVQYLADAFKSDLWLKALDLQCCGITTEGANYLLDGLKFNAMMHVLDVRLNVGIDRDTLQKIMEQVMINSSGNNTEYEWLTLSQQSNLGQKSSSLSPNVQKKNKKRRNTNTSLTKKTQINTLSSSLSKMKRCKSTGSVLCNKSPIASTKPGIPWRAAARASRFRALGNPAYRRAIGLSSSSNNQCEDENDDEYEEEILDEDQDQLDELRNNESSVYRPSRNYMVASSTLDFEKLGNQSKNVRQRKSLLTVNDSVDLASNLDKIKNVSVKDLLAILQKEQEAKSQLEDLLLEFQDENNKLKSQISVYKSRVEQQQHEIHKLQSKNSASMNRTVLDDDKALEIIELTLYKYQNFLDFLRNAGFGKLIDIGEMTHDKKAKTKQAEVIKQQKKLYKEKMASGPMSKSPNKSSTDQQKYFLEKINRTKSKMNKNYDSVYNSSRMDSTLNESHDIDTLLSNALEISRTYRKFNSSSINNSTMYNGNQRRNNEMMLSEIEEANKENSNLNESELPSFDDMAKNSHVVLADAANKHRMKKKAITTTSLDEDLVSEHLKKSSSSVSPTNTVVNVSKSAPKVSARTLVNKNSMSETCDREIEVEDVSEILSEEETNYRNGKQSDRVSHDDDF